MELSISRGCPCPWLSECPSYSGQPVGSRKKVTLCKRTSDPIGSGAAATHSLPSVLTWSHSILERRCRRQHEPASQSENIATRHGPCVPCCLRCATIRELATNRPVDANAR